MDLGVADDGERTVTQQAAQSGAVTLLLDTAVVLAPARAPAFGTRLIEAEKFRPIGWSWVSETGDESESPTLDRPRNVMKALARFIGPVPGHDHPIELHNLRLQAEQLGAECGKACARNLRHPFVARVGNNMEQFRDSFAPDRRDNAELSEVGSDRINHRGLLADKQMARAMKHQATLLLRGLGWHKPHGGSGDGFTNRLSIGHVVLLPFDVGLHIGRRHQAYRMTERRELRDQ